MFTDRKGSAIAGVGALALFGALMFAGAPSPFTSFQSAKSWLPELYATHPETEYCGCRFDPDTLEIDLWSCSFEPVTTAGVPITTRLKVEWDHQPAAADMGQQRACWNEGGREACERDDPVFSRATSDPHLLAPAIGQVNAFKSDRDVREGKGFAKFQGCEVSASGQSFFPPEATLGRDARKVLYAHAKYGTGYTAEEIQAYRKLSMDHPPDDWEIERAKRIQAKTGIRQAFILDWPAGSFRAFEGGGQ